MKDESARDGNKPMWAHDEAPLANSLTKGHEPRQIRLYYNCGARWIRVYDEKFRIARSRKIEGVKPFEPNHTPDRPSQFFEGNGLQDHRYDELTGNEFTDTEEMHNLENTPSCKS